MYKPLVPSRDVRFGSGAAAPMRLRSRSVYPSSLSDLAQRAGLGRIGALIRPFFVAGWDAIGQFPHD
jgi:hypothetical protein